MAFAHDVEENFGEPEINLITERYEPRSAKKFGIVGILAGIAIGAVLALAWSSTSHMDSAKTNEITSEIEIVAQAAQPMCTDPYTKVHSGDVSPGGGNCILTKCCSVTGYSCFMKSPGVAGCLESCDSKKQINGETWDCSMPNKILPLVEAEVQPNTTLYCFSAYTSNTGSTKRSFELELLQKQFSMGVGVFSCQYHDIFSDADAMIGPGFPTIRVTDVNNEFHLIKRKKAGTWVNTGLFKQIWKAVNTQGKWSKASWVVKADADAVFVPWRLVNMLAGQAVSYSGMYIEHCLGVKFGYFGSLEVMSQKAFKILLDNIDWCSGKIDWAKETATKWGPIGEDLFAQMCMDYKGVSKLQNFDISTDGVCPGDGKKWLNQKVKGKWHPDCSRTKTPAIHPFKKPEKWVECLTQTSALDR